MFRIKRNYCRKIQLQEAIAFKVDTAFKNSKSARNGYKDFVASEILLISVDLFDLRIALKRKYDDFINLSYIYLIEYIRQHFSSN